MLAPSLLLGALAGIAVPCTAQEPLVASVFPIAGQRGTAVDIEIRGKNLLQATSLWTDCADLRASVQKVEEIEKPTSETPPPPKKKGDKGGRDHRVRLRLEIAPSTRVGAHAIRLVSTQGISNPLALQITAEAVVLESATPGDRPADVQRLGFPVVLAGKIAAPGELDRYRIEAPAGRELLFEVITGTGLFFAPYSALYASGAENFRSPELALYETATSWLDPQRLLPVRCDDHSLYFHFPPLTFWSHHLPRLTHRFARGGTYVVEVGAGEGAGGPDFAYALRIVPVEAGTSVAPLWTPRELAHTSNPDWNEHTFARGLDAERLRVLRARAHPASLPAPPPGDAPAAGTKNSAGAQPEPPAPAAAAAAAGLDLPASIVREREPNDEPGQAPELTLPALVTGAVARPGDVDLYRLRVKPGEKLAFEVETTGVPHPYFAPRLSVVDAGGREIFNNLYRMIDGDGDDWIKSPEAKVLYTFDKGGEYILRIQDLTSRNGDPRFTYRVLVRPQIPHLGRVAAKMFRTSGSSTEIEEDRVNLRVGEARKLAFVAESEEGLAADLVLGVENLPQGVEVLPAVTLAQASNALGTAGTATFASDGDVIAGRYENRGTIDKERFRPKRRLLTVALAARSDASPTVAPRLVRFVITPYVQGKAGPRIPVYELPLTVSRSSSAESTAANTGKPKPVLERE